MWFAALSSYQHQPWIIHLVHKFLSGLPSEIEQITGPLPTEFHSSPPKFVRGVLYNYAFTTERDSKAWWQRTGVVNEQYIPPIENGVLCISCAFAADCASWK